MLQCCHTVPAKKSLGKKNQPVCWSIVVRDKKNIHSTFLGVLSSDRIPKATKDINSHFCIQSSNSCILQQRIPVNYTKKLWDFFKFLRVNKQCN
jgi:hypothetical protein